MKIDKAARISPLAVLDKTHPQGIVIGKGSYISARALILTHDHLRNRHLQTIIKENCFIGYGAMIMPGIIIHNNSIVAAGAIVTKDVESNCIVAGNPAKVIKRDIKTGEFGCLLE